MKEIIAGKAEDVKTVVRYLGNALNAIGVDEAEVELVQKVAIAIVEEFKGRTWEKLMDEAEKQAEARIQTLDDAVKSARSRK